MASKKSKDSAKVPAKTIPCLFVLSGVGQWALGMLGVMSKNQLGPAVSKTPFVCSSVE